MDPVLLEEQSWIQAQKLFALPDAVGLLPIGATEAHGPHLPLFTDVYLSLAWCDRIANALWGERTCIVLPPVTISVATYAAGFAGTLSISPETAGRMLTEMLDALGRSGLRIVALVNSHLEPGHIEVLERVAAAPREKPRVLFVNHCRKPWALELSDEFKSGDCHAGSYETSLLLASKKQVLVWRHRDRLPPAHHGLVAKMKAGVKTFEEMGASQAYFGNPAAASAAEGEKLWEVLTRMWVETIRKETA